MIVGTIRELYEQQEFNFAGPLGDNSFLEGLHRSRPRRAHRLCRSSQPQCRRVDPAHRGELPAGSLLLLSGLVGEKLAGTPYVTYFAGES